MRRIQGSTTIDLGGGRNGFRDENLVAGVEGTDVTAEFLNGVQEELLAVIEAAGLTPTDTDTAQVLAALRAIGAGVARQQYFGSSGTFVVPAGVTRVRAQVWGGGGGGSGGSGASGAAGGYASEVVTVTPGQSITVTVGVGGGSGSSGAAAGNGGTTSFGGFLSATGGAGASAGPGAGGTGSGGQVNATGQNGVDLDGTATTARGGLPPMWIGAGAGGDAFAAASAGNAGQSGAVLVEW